MAILRNTYLLLLLAMFSLGLTSCYQDFDPKIESTPVLCMNAEITPGDSINLFLTRTWRWDEDDQYRIDNDVRDAEVRLIVNGEYKETLRHTVLLTEDYRPSNPYGQERKCYQSTYRPASGDVIRIEASSPQYGEAWAETKVPFPVPIDRVEPQIQEFRAYGDTTGFPAVMETCEFMMKFKLLVYFTDPADSTNYYDFMMGTSGYSNYDNEAEAYTRDFVTDFSGEPLFTEHVSVLESAIADTYGYTIFSDRQINGLTYPLRTSLDCTFLYRNPFGLEEPEKYGIVATLRHVDSAYYNHVLSLWEANDAIVGALGGVGLASPVYAYSNVSTGAGLVTAYAISRFTLPLVDIIRMANRNMND